MCGPTSWGDGESCPGGGRYLKSRTPAMYCHTAWGQWAVGLLLCTAILLKGGGQRAAQLLQCTASLPVWCGVVWCGVLKALYQTAMARVVLRT